MTKSGTGRNAWWQGAIIYQVYPRSYLDTTGNGVGDLEGIKRKLDHIATLGADAVWVSPFVKSPMRDFGYDVADYLSVDPLFGTLDDFESLLAAAHERGLKVMIDQVFSHTSNEHPWFLESRESRTNPKANWYVWADPKPDGAPPNNWLSVFGGSSWQWEPRRSQYYLHNFLREQPDLNYHEPEVQEAVLDVSRFWLDMGVDGFRLDVCSFYFHDAELRDNPPNPQRPSGRHFMFNPYSLQLHTRDIGQPENLTFLERLRALTDGYEDRVLLGELHENEGVRLHTEYTEANRLQLAYGYWLLGADRLDAETIARTATDLGHEMHSGWPCWALDNHDFMRSPTRLGPDAASGELPFAILAALSCLRGALCLYQGSELGLEEAEVPHERMIDPYGREFYPAFAGRDGARTPMPWNTDEPHCGFSRVEPWLPIPAGHAARAVATQEGLPGSLLNRMKRFFAWRREHPALLRGGLRFVSAPEGILAFERMLDGQKVSCVFNLKNEEAEANFSDAFLGHPRDGHGFGGVRAGETLKLPALGAYFGGQA
ncbi:putative alpha-glucosidase [Agaricicola taiwanensis]|uniref:Putative alpha-glucosidase n=1 Tax=Agaricicola taiwanensis TaxID=591372 RepID=A0A8J2VLA4_9RHOB|nr:alpha-glucosidase family protein [Agaricicola taiwanensis]GGE31340.1 putative alpha-glucosidase [Agaricicola taiwanensis]